MARTSRGARARATRSLARLPRSPRAQCRTASANRARARGAGVTSRPVPRVRHVMRRPGRGLPRATALEARLGAIVETRVRDRRAGLPGSRGWPSRARLVHHRARHDSAHSELARPAGPCAPDRTRATARRTRARLRLTPAGRFTARATALVLGNTHGMASKRRKGRSLPRTGGSRAQKGLIRARFERNRSDELPEKRKREVLGGFPGARRRSGGAR